ncbi:MAG TPA: universal stress protein [Chthoniobacterales bacterium]
MKTILVPLDFSDLYPKVVDVAGQLARELDASLYLLQVVEPVTSYVPVGAAMDVIVVPPPAPVAADLAEEKKTLEAVAAPLRADGLNVQTEVILGLPVDEILVRAKTLPADFIVLGSHGHGALYHLFTGSVVTGVLKQAEIPVIVVPARRAA